MIEPYYIRAHKHSSLNRAELLRSYLCGCFHCLATFTPAAIVEWIDELGGVGDTALCPLCGIDSVIGSSSGFPITLEFLNQMHKHWF